MYQRGEEVEMLKKLKLGLLTLSAFALLVACGPATMEDETPMDEPGIEEPAGGIGDDTGDVEDTE